MCSTPRYRLTFRYDGLSRRVTKKVEQQTAVGGPWNVVNFDGYFYQGWYCIMCVRFNNDETVSTPPTVRGRVASYVWGPDLGSGPEARGNWQKAGGVTRGIILALVCCTLASCGKGTTRYAAGFDRDAFQSLKVGADLTSIYSACGPPIFVDTYPLGRHPSPTIYEPNLSMEHLKSLMQDKELLLALRYSQPSAAGVNYEIVSVTVSQGKIVHFECAGLSD